MVDCGSPSLSFQNDIINYGFIACTSKCKVSVCKTKCNPALEFKFTNEFFQENLGEIVDTTVGEAYNIGIYEPDHTICDYRFISETGDNP